MLFCAFRKRLLNTQQVNYINLSLTSSALVISSYLGYVRYLPSCAFCTAVRLMLVLLMGLSLGSLFIPVHRRLIHPTQLGVSVISLLFSLRQAYFEQTVRRLIPCAKYSSNAFQAVFNWLYAGAPVCQKTASFGYLTLAGWSCIIFGALSLLALQFYLKKPSTVRKLYRK